MNLSSHVLTESEVSLLSKGLKFIPKPLKSNPEAVFQSTADFIRRMKLRNFFRDQSHKDPSKFDENQQQPLFIGKSNWTPPDKLIEEYLINEFKELEETITKIPLSQINDNLSKKERKALRNLKNNENIIIKPADKGSTTVIMNKT